MKTIYSWIVINNSDFLKIIDKSVIKSKESGIPHEAMYLFDLEEDKDIYLVYKNKGYVAKISTSNCNGTSRSKIRFNTLIDDLDEPIEIGDYMFFTKVMNDVYKVEFIRHKINLNNIKIG